jgi:hypothetical protein
MMSLPKTSEFTKSQLFLLLKTQLLLKPQNSQDRLIKRVYLDSYQKIKSLKFRLISSKSFLEKESKWDLVEMMTKNYVLLF